MCRKSIGYPVVLPRHLRLCQPRAFVDGYAVRGGSRLSP